MVRPLVRVRKWLLLGLLLSLVSLVGLGSLRGDPTGVGLGTSAAAGVATAVDLSKPVSTWFCPGAQATDGSRLDGQLRIANPTSQRVEAAVTLFGESSSLSFGQDAPSARVPLVIEAQSQASLNLRDALSSTYAGALVESPIPGLVVEMRVGNDRQSSISPCLTRSSKHWFLADGRTTRDSTLIYCLFNPFPEDAIVDLSFVTEEGELAPDAYKALLVKARSVLALDVGQEVIRHEYVSGRVDVTVGRLSVWRLQHFDGTAFREGVLVSSASPELEMRSDFPSTVLDNSGYEQLHFFNPTPVETHAVAEFVLEEGSVEPMDVTVPANGRFTVDLHADPRVPKGSSHGILVSVLDGEGLVVDRSVDGLPGAASRGVDSQPGLATSAKEWITGAAEVQEGASTQIWVLNTSGKEAEISVELQRDSKSFTPTDLQKVVVPAGARAQIVLEGSVEPGSYTAIVRSTGAIEVQRIEGNAVALGLNTAPLVPVFEEGK